MPVIRDAGARSLPDLAQVINDLVARARRGALRPEEVRGGSFTISNHGTGGSLAGTPFINAPQAAILGVGALQRRVVAIGDAIAIRPRCTLSLGFDHRVIDGADADAFMRTLVATLESPAETESHD